MGTTSVSSFVSGIESIKFGVEDFDIAVIIFSISHIAVILFLGLGAG